MASKEATRTRKSIWLRIILGLAIGIALLFVSTYLLMFHAFYSFADLPLLLRPLPSDEQMIANFHQHRADFERLVQIYREDLSIPTNVIGHLEPTPQIKGLMSRINVDAVEGDGMVWMLPDPYSNDPSFVKQRTGIRWPEKRKFSGIKLGYACGTIITYHFGLISKNYYYVPLTPRVSNGRLLLILSPPGGDPWITETLNSYPLEFRQYDCFCKQIEPHWFIEMCRIQ